MSTLTITFADSKDGKAVVITDPHHGPLLERFRRDPESLTLEEVMFCCAVNAVLHVANTAGHGVRQGRLQ